MNDKEINEITRGLDFEFANRVELVLDRIDVLAKLDVREIKNVGVIVKAASGACGVACGGC